VSVDAEAEQDQIEARQLAATRAEYFRERRSVRGGTLRSSPKKAHVRSQRIRVLTSARARRS